MEGDESTPARARALDAIHRARQHLYPKRLLSALMYRATRVRFAPWKDWQIRWFIRRYGVDMAVALAREPGAYADFNSFFTRELRAGARPIEGGADDLVSPADGILSHAGRAERGELIQAKGRAFDVARLLGGDPQRAAPFAGAAYTTIYLSPRDYHRVHMPLAGRLREMVYVPGDLFSVNPRTARVVSGLFARNERVASIFDTDLGPLAVVMVGAVFVGGIEQVWCGPVPPPRGRRIEVRRYDGPEVSPVGLARGAEVGRFNMGSTVIVLLANDRFEWSAGLEPPVRVRVGQRLGGA